MPIALVPPFRYGEPGDAEALVDFVAYASEGLAPYVWSKLAPPGTTAREFALSRAGKSDQPIGTHALIVAEDDGAAAAGMIDFPIPRSPEPVDRTKLPPIVVPIKELEAEAAGTWYINILAAYPTARNRGWGSRLIALARQRAADAGTARITLVVSDGNGGARRLYERHGFSEISSRPLIREDWETASTRWLLYAANIE